MLSKTFNNDDIIPAYEASDERVLFCRRYIKHNFCHKRREVSL